MDLIRKFDVPKGFFQADRPWGKIDDRLKEQLKALAEEIDAFPRSLEIKKPMHLNAFEQLLGQYLQDLNAYSRKDTYCKSFYPSLQHEYFHKQPHQNRQMIVEEVKEQKVIPAQEEKDQIELPEGPTLDKEAAPLPSAPTPRAGTLPIGLVSQQSFLKNVPISPRNQYNSVIGPEEELDQPVPPSPRNG